MKRILILIFTLFIFGTTFNLKVYADMKFPTPEGQNFTWWTAYPTLWHSSSTSYSAIDIGAGSGEMNVLATEAGTIIDAGACTNSGYIKVQHTNGVYMEYWHLDKATMEFGLNTQGKSIKQGQFLGKLWKGNLNEPACGSALQSPSLGHLHWVMPRTATSVDGYVFDEPSMSACKTSGGCVSGGSTLPSTNPSLVLYNGTVTGNSLINDKVIMARNIKAVSDGNFETIITSSGGNVVLRAE